VAPEVLNDKGYDGRAADIWSSGVILYVLLAGFLPFDEPHMSQLFRKIQKAEFTYPSWFTPQVRSLLDRIMVADPTKRATIAELEAHPWFIGPDDYHDDNDASTPGGGAAPAGAGGAASAPAPVRPLAHAPSEKEIEESIADIDGDDDKTPSAPASSAAGGAGTSSAPHSSRASDGGSGAAGAATSGGPPALNAFEVSTWQST
jgi:serine/threonine protein kinase